MLTTTQYGFPKLNPSACDVKVQCGLRQPLVGVPPLHGCLGRRHLSQIPDILMVEGTSNGPQNQIGKYFGFYVRARPKLGLYTGCIQTL